MHSYLVPREDVKKGQKKRKKEAWVTDLNIITTPDEKCWETVLVELPNCLLQYETR